jgi:hypothetical protein
MKTQLPLALLALSLLAADKPAQPAEKPVEVADIYKANDDYVAKLKGTNPIMQRQIVADWTAAMKQFGGKQASLEGEVVGVQSGSMMVRVRYDENGKERAQVDCYTKDHDWFKGLKVHDKVKVTGKVTQTAPNLSGAVQGNQLLIGFRLDNVKPSEP